MNTLPVPAISFFGYILPFLGVLTVVVFFHELGHFLVGRWNKVKIDAFSVGFGPELIGFNDKHGTRWKLCLIPLGGYVKFYGDANAASTPDFEAAAQMNDEEKSGSFLHKTVGQRAAVVAAGPIANFILALVIFSLSFMFFGRYVSEPVVNEVLPNSAAAAAGFQVNDKVIEIDGTLIAAFSDIPRIIAPNPDREVVIKVERAGQIVEMNVTPRKQERIDRFGNKHSVGILGIGSDPKTSGGQVIKSGPLEAVGQAAAEIWYIISSTLNFLKDIIMGYQSADNLSGPIGIAKVSGEVATLGAAALINLAALLSVSIGLLNLFPIPMLDGGHLVFYAFEAVLGRPVNERMQEYGARIGLSLVLMLMIFATWNDISRIFSS